MFEKKLNRSGRDLTCDGLIKHIERHNGVTCRVVVVREINGQTFRLPFVRDRPLRTTLNNNDIIEAEVVLPDSSDPQPHAGGSVSGGDHHHEPRRKVMVKRRRNGTPGNFSDRRTPSAPDAAPPCKIHPRSRQSRMVAMTSRGNPARSSHHQHNQASVSACKPSRSAPLERCVGQ